MSPLDRVPVLVAAGGARWEVAALQALAAHGPGLVLLKRCVDLPDLLASAATGEARVALVAHDLPGLDADSVAHLRRCGTALVVVTGDDTGGESGGDTGERVRRLGVTDSVDARGVPAVAAVLARAAAHGEDPGEDFPAVEVSATPSPVAGRTVVVWGPRGAPGRTTVAVTLAAELARRGNPTFLLDVDACGGAVGQHLGMLEEVSGLLSAARLANAGRLDAERLSALARQVGPHLRVLTGLPRADRWAEVREPAFEQILEVAAAMAEHVVLDTSSSLEQDPSPFGAATPRRNGMTLTALERADEVLVVGAADPVGLARLARGLVELHELVPEATVRVAVNRVRDSLGWREQDIRAMVEGYVSPSGVHFLPDDRAAADRALVRGRSLVEVGDSALRSAVSGVVDGLLGGGGAPSSLRPRTAGRGRRRCRTPSPPAAGSAR